MKCPHCSKDIRDVLVISEAEKIREKRAKKNDEDDSKEEPPRREE